MQGTPFLPKVSALYTDKHGSSSEMDGSLESSLNCVCIKFVADVVNSQLSTCKASILLSVV